MHAADLPTRMWLEVLQYIVDINNMSATLALNGNGKTTSENLLGYKPDVSKIEVCGPVGFVYVSEEERSTKLRDESYPGLILGLDQVRTRYELLYLRTGDVLEARDVQYRDDITLSKQHFSAFLKGQCGIHDKILQVLLPVEFVVKKCAK